MNWTKQPYSAARMSFITCPRQVYRFRNLNQGSLFGEPWFVLRRQLTLPMKYPDAPVFDRDTQIAVLYRDEHLLALHKPSGMVVHPTDLARRENISLMVLARRITRQRVWPLHRLDRPTSGVVLFALDRQSAQRVAEQFRNHDVQKRYLALVRGIPRDQTIDYPLKERPLYRSDLSCAESQPALTSLRLRAHIEIPVSVGRYATSRYALVELSPTTGRRHQLRRHMKHIFHPIIGDTTYGDGPHNRFFREHLESNRLLLAAVALNLKHPHTGLPLSINAQLEHSFSNVLRRLGLNANGPPPGQSSDSSMEL